MLTTLRYLNRPGGNMNDVLALLYLLKELETLIKLSLQKSNAPREHTFIAVQKATGAYKIRRLTLPEDTSDEAIRGVMRWQMKGLKQN